MRYKSKFKHDYETIFDFELPDDFETNPAYSPFSTLMKWDRDGTDVFRDRDTAYWKLGRFFATVRNDKERAWYYWNKMENKSLHRLMWQDFP